MTTLALTRSSIKLRGGPLYGGPLCRGGILSVVLLLILISSRLPGAVITVFSDNFQAQTLGAVPAAPTIGLPWQVSVAVSNGALVTADPFTSNNSILQFGPAYDVAVAPLSSAAQTAVGSNGNATLSFTYHGSISSGWVSSFDAGLYAPDGSIATLIRIEPQTTGGTANVHSIYYLSPTNGLVNSGLTIPGDSWQSVSLTANLSGNGALLLVGTNSATLPLYSCPSMLADAQFDSYAMGGGGAILGSGAIDNVNITSQGIAPFDSVSTPEPATLALLVVGACLAGLAWGRARFWGRRRS